jgi:hypothetical protein
MLSSRMPQLPSLYAVVEDLTPSGPMTPSKSPVKLMTDVELPSDKRYRTKVRRASKQFRSPFIYTSMKLEETTPRAKPSTRLHVRQSASTNESFDEEVLEYLERSHLNPIADIEPCSVCGATPADQERLDDLRSRAVEVVPDIQFSLKCIQMLEALSFELTQDSRSLHFKLLHQLQYAIFPEESPGVYSRASYFSIYEQLGKERADLQEDLEKAKLESETKGREIAGLKAKASQLEGAVRDYESKVLMLEKTNSRLQEGYDQLLEKYTKARDSATELQNEVSVLHSELKLKDQAVQLTERTFHSQADNLLTKIQELQLEVSKPVAVEKLLNPTPPEELDLSRLRVLETELLRLKRTKEKQDKLYRVMRTCYEKDMKAFKSCMNSKMYEQRIDQGPKTRNYLQRVKMETLHYRELSNLTAHNISDLSFDELVKVATDIVLDAKVEVENYKTRYDELESIYLELQLSLQESKDQLAEIKTRISYSELYVEDFSLVPVKTEKLFVGLGRTLEVPRFLRTNGFVNNLNLSKRDALAVIHELWAVKQTWQNKMKRQLPMPIFLYNFLRNKFNYQPKVIEYGYNLMETAERYSEEPDLEMFLLIIKNEFPEQLYYDCTRMVKTFRKYLGEVANRNKLDSLPKPMVVKCIHSFFPQRRPKDVEILQSMLFESETCDPDLLFEGEGEEQTVFVQCLKKQYLMDLQRFYTELSSQLLLQGDRANSAISVLLLKQIYAQVDGGITVVQAAIRLAPLLGAFIGEDKALVSVPSAVVKMKSLLMKPVQLYVSSELF